MRKIAESIVTLLVLSLLTPTNILAQIGSIPTLKVVTPSENQTIYGNRIPLLFAVENFTIVDFQKNPIPAVNQGHIHLWLDDQTPTAESATKVTSDSFTFTDVAYGPHTLKAELVTNNHQSLTPPVVVAVNFKNAPVVTPSPLTTSGFDKNTALVILVIVALVIIAAWWYTKEEETPTKTTTKSKKPTRRRKKK